MLIYLRSVAVFQDLQQETQQSIKRFCQDSLSNDWLESEKTKKIPLSSFHTDLVWTKKEQRIRDSRKTMKGLNEILEVDGAGEKRLIFVAEGKKISQKTFRYCQQIESNKGTISFAKSRLHTIRIMVHVTF